MTVIGEPDLTKQTTSASAIRRAQGLSSTEIEKLGYRPSLDGLRAVAITLVLLFHAALFARYRSFVFPQQGVLGVDLFFVLSGFLITTLLLEEQARSGRVSLRGFYARRARRLLPALVLLLSVALVATAISASIHHDSDRLVRELKTTAYALTFLTNIGVVWDSSSIAFGMGHLWSLATEEQFYLVWPITLIVVARFKAYRASLILSAALIAELAQEVRLYHANAGFSRIGLAPDTRSAGIIIGCLVAVLLRTDARGKIMWAAKYTAPFAAVGCLLLLSLHLSDPDMYVGGTALFSLLAAVVMVGVLEPRSLIGKTLALTPVVYLGRISYSLYLWHFPIFYSARFFYGSKLLLYEGIALSVIAAVISYQFVELRYLRRRKPPLRRIESRTTEVLEP